MIITTIITVAVPSFTVGLLTGGFIWHKLICRVIDHHKDRACGVIFASRDTAEQTLTDLIEVICIYGYASVADFKDLAGVTPNFTDRKYGWTNLGSAYTHRTRGGYSINFPDTKLLG